MVGKSSDSEREERHETASSDEDHQQEPSEATANAQAEDAVSDTAYPLQMDNEEQARLKEKQLEMRELEMREKSMTLQYESSQAEMERREKQRALQYESERQRLESELKLQWTVARMRVVLSFLVVGGFVGLTFLVILLSAFGKASTDTLQVIATLYSGVTGAVLGYYFGKQSDQ